MCYSLFRPLTIRFIGQYFDWCCKYVCAHPILYSFNSIGYCVYVYAATVLSSCCPSIFSIKFEILVVSQSLINTMVSKSTLKYGK